MPVEKGQPWGRQQQLSDEAPIAYSDLEVRSLIEQPWRDGMHLPTLGLAGGDLCRTVGGRGDVPRMRSEHAQALPCDAIKVSLDGQTNLCVAHVVIRRSWLFGSVTVVMNAAWMGEWNVAPRSHPGDARLDVLSTDTMGLGERLKARQRASHGGHVPHPAIEQRRVTKERPLVVELDRSTPVYLDGQRAGSATLVEIGVLPDLFEVVV